MSTALDQKYETVIGLEVHLQFNTESKMFCSAPNMFGSDPNTNISPVCLGLPGSLPVVNKKALEYAIKVGLALNCEINSFVKFDRKNYYYPDLPKGYQISQFDFPIARDGKLIIPNGDEETKEIRIHRAHLEEDAGKLIHDNENNCSLVDYNRTGTPLMEIVTEPDIRSAQEAYDYLQTLKLTLQYLNVSDCDMEKGSLRCDANISIRPMGDEKLGTKTELKNMNSFKAVKTGLEFEINRHRQVIESGEKIVQETRLWDDEKQMTRSMRSKEDAHDYRYFPEPDLVPFELEESIINEIKETIPELPKEKFERLVSDYKLTEYDARIIVQDPLIANFFEECAKEYKEVKKICNWINGPLLQELNNKKTDLNGIKLPPNDLITLIQKVDDGTLSNLAAKDAFKLIIESDKTTEEIINEQGLAQVSDEGELEQIVEELIKEHDKIVQQIQEGKESAIGFLIGQAMKKTQGKANPKVIGELIKRRLLNG